MIKKIFLGIFIAGVFGFLVLGAVNRTLVKIEDREPLAFSEKFSSENGNGNRGENDDSAIIHQEDQWGSAKNTPPDGAGIGKADITSWESFEGKLVSTSDDLWEIAPIDGGTTIELKGRALRYVLDQGITANIGDTAFLTGFYDGDTFEIGIIELKDKTGIIESLTLRDENGHPLWAGNAQSGAGSQGNNR